MNNLTHKEMTAHIRKCLKDSGVKARCRKLTVCGRNLIQVFSIEHNLKFSIEDIRTIALIAKSNRLTGAEASEIHPDHEALLTGKTLWTFEFYGGGNA